MIIEGHPKMAGRINTGGPVFSERIREGSHRGEEKRSAETGNWTFEGEDGAFAPETWAGSASQPCQFLFAEIRVIRSGFACWRRGGTGGLWQEFDDFPVFPDNHRNAHETVFLGGFLHGPLHDFGNFLNALVCGFHGGSR